LILHQNRIYANKGASCLRIPKSKTLDSLGEPDEDTLLRFGFQFVHFSDYQPNYMPGNRKFVRLN